jgi:hypothetical protein
MNLTTAQAAKALGVSIACVTSLCRRGKLAGATEPLGAGRGYLIPADAVAARLRAAKSGKLPKGGRPKSLSSQTE